MDILNEIKLVLEGPRFDRVSSAVGKAGMVGALGGAIFGLGRAFEYDDVQKGFSSFIHNLDKQDQQAFVKKVLEPAKLHGALGAGAGAMFGTARMASRGRPMQPNTMTSNNNNYV